jgi:hypothetical protein
MDLARWGNDIGVRRTLSIESRAQEAGQKVRDSGVVIRVIEKAGSLRKDLAKRDVREGFTE